MCRVRRGRKPEDSAARPALQAPVLTKLRNMEGSYMTRKTAGAVVLALVLALVAPGFSQPFADVPTNHWAYDAIAELAAKGLIEGYPDGT
ncbi:MAG: S-layer homology domain-containing protein, partial [Armatimonadota bacterium]|nr:S-layer homology domain-containing protein [Armatimonadota bacterium]